MKAFSKLGLVSSTDLVSEFSSDFSKSVLSKFGYLGKRQQRAICAKSGKFWFFLCRFEQDKYEMLIERDSVAHDDDTVMKRMADEFQSAYIEVAVEEAIKKIERTGVPVRLSKLNSEYVIEFGTSFEMSVRVTVVSGKVTEEVFGVKGDVCTKLTEELEAILSRPSAELITEWKPEYSVAHEDRVLQVLSLNL